MATFTAQILVGATDAYGGGILPTHALFLSEGSRPAWILTSLNLECNNESSGQIVWVAPPVKSILETGLLMVAIHLEKVPQLVARFVLALPGGDGARVELGELATSHHWVELIALARQVNYRVHIVVSVFCDSTIADQLDVLKAYGMSMEVCPWSYAKIRSGDTLREFTPRGIERGEP